MTFQLIPAIDIIQKRLVRLYKGQYDHATQYDRSPLDMALHYESMGLRHLHVVDLDGAKDGDLVNQDTIESIVLKTTMTVQIGGGIRTMDHAAAWLDMGVSAVILGSLVVHDFDAAVRIIHRYPQRIIVGLDVNDGRIATHGWQHVSDVSLADMLARLNDCPLHSIVTTDIQRDGSFEGPNTDLYNTMRHQTSHPIVASGGVASIDDVHRLRRIQSPSLRGCIVGKAIIENRINAKDVQGFELAVE